MKTKKLWALLIAAALALSLVLTGCGSGKNQSLSQMLLNLLDGQYQNVSVELDPELESKLRQAAGEGETEEEIRAALEKLLGGGIHFQLLGDGQKGDSAWSLVIYPGNDPDAAARSAYLDWNKVFSSLPGDGRYAAGLAMIETENGYAILVRATVEKAGSRDDDDDEPDDVVVEGTGFSYNVTKKTITVEPGENGSENGLQELFFDSTDSAVQAARNSGFEGVTIELEAGETYTVDTTTAPLAETFKGTLTSADNKAKITLSGGASLFGTIAGGGEVSYLDITVTQGISVSKNNSDANAGAVAGQNYGTITGCDVTISNSIEANSSVGVGYAYAGGIVGKNETGGHISGCEVIVDGTISAERSDANSAYAGGLAGYNWGTIDGNCKVEVTGTIQATGTGAGAYAGGIAGLNNGTVSCGPATSSGTGTNTIQATAGNNEASVPNSDESNPNTDTKGNASAGTKCGMDSSGQPSGS